MPDLLLNPVPNDVAAKFIAAKPVVARQVFQQLLPDLQARAFMISGIEDANIVQAVRDRIADLPKGADWDAIKGDIAAQLSPFLDAGADGTAASERRAELLLRTNGFQAYSAAQFEVMDRQKGAFPYWQYLTMEDERVRDSHAALDLLVLPADSEFWADHYPPWDWGCRCQVVPLLEEDVADIEAEDADKKPEEQRVLDASRLKELETSGRLTRALPDAGGLPAHYDVRAPDQRGGSYVFKPGTLKMNVADLRGRYDPETWHVFENWARAQTLDDGRTVLDWLNAAAPSTRPKPIAQKVVPPAEPVSPAIPFKLAASTVENTREAIRSAEYKSQDDISRGVNTVLLLKNGKKIVFKSSEGEHQSQLRDGIEPGTQYLREAAASILDEELGLGLVPPTTLLTYQGEEGSAQLFLERYKAGDEIRNLHATLGRLTERQKQDWQLFDELAGNLDRHAGNFMLRSHAGVVDLALIDNGLTFATERARWPISGYLVGKPIDAMNLTRLADLLTREAAIRARLEPLLEKDAINLFFTRARTLLRKKTYGIR